jgi:hypothetical protein
MGLKTVYCAPPDAPKDAVMSEDQVNKAQKYTVEWQLVAYVTSILWPILVGDLSSMRCIAGSENNPWLVTHMDKPESDLKPDAYLAPYWLLSHTNLMVVRQIKLKRLEHCVSL